MKKQKIVNISGYEAMLSERFAYDVRELEEFTILHRDKINGKLGMMIACTKISDALLPAARQLKFYQLIQKAKYRKLSKISWLIKHLSDNEMIYLVNEISILEDAEKKKETPQENLSAGQKQNH